MGNTAPIWPWTILSRRRDLGAICNEYSPQLEDGLHLFCEWSVDRAPLVLSTGFPGGLVVKNPPKCRKQGFDPWVGKIPWRRKWQPTPAFLPGKSHGQRSLAGDSPWGHKESDATEHTQQQQHLLQEDSRRTSTVLFY